MRSSVGEASAESSSGALSHSSRMGSRKTSACTLAMASGRSTAPVSMQPCAETRLSGRRRRSHLERANRRHSSASSETAAVSGSSAVRSSAPGKRRGCRRASASGRRASAVSSGTPVSALVTSSASWTSGRNETASVRRSTCSRCAEKHAARVSGARRMKKQPSALGEAVTGASSEAISAPAVNSVG